MLLFYDWTADRVLHLQPLPACASEQACRCRECVCCCSMIGLQTEYFTSNRYQPVQARVDENRDGIVHIQLTKHDSGRLAWTFWDCACNLAR